MLCGHERKSNVIEPESGKPNSDKKRVPHCRMVITNVSNQGMANLLFASAKKLEAT
jgi:hypothetical protein